MTERIRVSWVVRNNEADHERSRYITVKGEKMFKLMRFYLLHKHWRTRLAMNQAASNIWVCWLICLCFSLVLVISIIFQNIDFVSGAALLGAATLSFAASFAFLREAKRIHTIRYAARNKALFGDGHE